MEVNRDCITPEDVKAWLTSGTDIQLIDVRSREEYEEKHIPDAMHIPLALLALEAGTLTHEKKYITICGRGGGRSADAAQLLKETGLQAWWLCGGTFGWGD
jgi:rhodanese-related sulfurtransferase